MNIFFSPPEILLAVALDLALGDPRWFPHPVRLIGCLAERVEAAMRKLIPNERTAGVSTVLTVLVCSVGSAGLVLCMAGRVHPLAARGAAVLMLYFSIAGRDLAQHARQARRALAENNLAEARRRAGMIVGRDTGDLDEPGVVRATVESVAESTVDGIAAPLFFAMLAGPLGAVLYRAANTLDSMFGYKHGRYIHFGWAAARFDDLLNFLPARLGALVIALAAGLYRQRTRQTMQIIQRDARQHASPNAGFPEAAFAGALNIQLGGPNSYFGKTVHKPTIGNDGERLAPNHISEAIRLMLFTLIFLAFLSAAVAILV